MTAFGLWLDGLAITILYTVMDRLNLAGPLTGKAHVYGQNENSLGICLIGRQAAAPKCLPVFASASAKMPYPDAEIVGHRDVQDTAKTCGDVRSWWAGATLLKGASSLCDSICTGLYRSRRTHANRIFSG